MNNTNTSGEHALSEQLRSLELQQNQNAILITVKPVNYVPNMNNLARSRVQRKSLYVCILSICVESASFFARRTRYYRMKRFHKAVCGSTLFTSIVMTIAILTVCLTSPKPNQSCQSSFKAAIYGTSVQINSNPYSIAVGDFNEDNLLDIVVANSGTNNIGTFLNYGNDTFAPQMTFTTGDGSRPLSAALGDFNNDTHLDIAVTNYDSHNIMIFLGYGNGTFTNQTVIPTGASRPVSIAVGDFNNDHSLDIVVTNQGMNTIGILFGYKNGSFGEQITYFTGYDSFSCFVVVDDFNNDHYPDIAVANYGTDNVGVFLGFGNGSFATQTIYLTGQQSNPYAIAVNDINNDGYLDIAVANSGTNTVGIFVGNGNGTFQSQMTHSISPGSRPKSIIIGDFNQDNLFDIATSNYDTNNITILIGDGNGNFTKSTMHSTGMQSSPFGMAIGDFDNDNQSDVAISNFATDNILILIGYSLIQSDSPTSYETGIGSIPIQIVTGDFDNDTQVDLAVVNIGTNTVGVFLGYGNGSFREQVTYSTGINSHPNSLAVGDLDNDYRLDIVVANSDTGPIGILYGYGNGTFATIVTYQIDDLSYLAWVIVDDFNKDNHLDIVFIDTGTNSIGIFLGYGNRSVGNRMTFSTGSDTYPSSIAAGDFNNDGQLDVVVTNYGTDSIGIFLGFGNGTFTFFMIYSTGDGSLPWMLTVADLNRDKNLDIIVANSGSNIVGIFIGFGNGSFGTQLTFSTGTRSKAFWISIADLNNDSWLDIAVSNPNNNNVGVLLGTTYGYFGSQTTYSTGSGSSPYSITIDDFNKDNRLDIATTNPGTSNVAILLGHPSEHSTNSTVNNMPILLGDYHLDFISQAINPTGSSSQPYAVAVGDLNNDTEMDLVVANSANENLGILLGYGNGAFASEITYSLGDGFSPRDVLMDDFNKDNQSDVAVINPINDRFILLLGYGDGIFSTEVTYFTGSGSNPTKFAIGNFNNDNYIDLVVVNQGTDAIGIYLGFNYTFFARETPCESGTTSNPYSVSTGDFNNDGYSDIVSALFNSNNVGVFLGYGNGSFRSLVTYSNVPSSHPYSVAVGDFNNDHQLDITVANWGSGNIGVLLGYGNGTFIKSILYSTSSLFRPTSASVGDFNNDSYLDITTANYGGNNIAVFLGYGNGTFRNVVIFACGQGSTPTSVTVSDINNDYHLDIIVANTGINSVGVFLGYGNGSFAEQVTSSTGTSSSPYYAIASDFDKDGRLDVAIANYGTSNVGILYGFGNGTFGNLQTYATGVGSNPTHVKIGDFNNDNQLDIIVADDTSTNVGVFFGYSDGTFASMSTFSIKQSSASYSVAISDFNNDNHLDFAIADYGNNNIGVFLANGSKPFGGQTTFSVGKDSHPTSVAVGHFNNDSQLDIAVTNYGTDNIGILLGYGSGLFSNVTTYSTGNNSLPSAIAVGDFNNDSFTDIVVANYETNNVVVLFGYGNGNFSTLVTYYMGDNSQPLSVAVGDFNRDYQLDIVVANFGADNVCILFGCGNGTFTNQTWYPLGYNSQPRCVVFKDLNKDGWKDIAVVLYGVDNIKILLNLC